MDAVIQQHFIHEQSSKAPSQSRAPCSLLTFSSWGCRRDMLYVVPPYCGGYTFAGPLEMERQVGTGSAYNARESILQKWHTVPFLVFLIRDGVQPEQWQSGLFTLSPATHFSPLQFWIKEVFSALFFMVICTFKAVFFRPCNQNCQNKKALLRNPT